MITDSKELTQAKHGFGNEKYTVCGRCQCQNCGIDCPIKCSASIECTFPVTKCPNKQLETPSGVCRLWRVNVNRCFIYGSYENGNYRSYKRNGLYGMLELQGETY